MSDLTKCQISDLSHLFVNGVLTVARGTVNISKNLHPLPLLMNIYVSNSYGADTID